MYLRQLHELGSNENQSLIFSRLKTSVNHGFKLNNGLVGQHFKLLKEAVSLWRWRCSIRNGLVSHVFSFFGLRRYQTPEAKAIVPALRSRRRASVNSCRV